MAHKSRKKHIKHVHDHEPATPPAKSPVAMAEAAMAGLDKTRTRGRRRRAAAGSETAKPGKKRGGLVRAIARAATKKVRAKTRRVASEVAAKPRKIVQRAKARVKSLLGAA